MSLWETFTLAVKNISGSKMRTFLTMLGIIIGVCAVIVIVGLGNGMAGYMEDSFAEMGTHTLTVSILYSVRSQLLIYLVMVPLSKKILIQLPDLICFFLSFSHNSTFPYSYGNIFIIR